MAVCDLQNQRESLGLLRLTRGSAVFRGAMGTSLLLA
jgi:hypothetical protein